MIGQVTPDYKERLLSRIDLVQLVGRRVQLKKAGKEFTACCPFHNEKTPSFTVSPAKQFYYCFGCGAHGNAIDFLIEHDRLNFPEAIEELAHSVGMELPAETDHPTGPDPRPILQTLEHAAALYQAQLREHPQAQRAIAYLKKRGLSGEISQRFGLGYAPPGWDFLLSRLGADAQSTQRLLDAGLLSENDANRRYDRFRDRIMFPIRDRRGRVVGFGGRVLDNDEPNKYLNSPETPVFHKGRELYGLFEANKHNRTLPRLLVVEGYMDVIALAQNAIGYAVATLGTATSADHVQRLLRSAPELVFCFDGDRAGRAAAWKALRISLPHATGQQPIRFLFLPDGEDPDSLVRKEGAAAFEQRIDGAQLLSDYIFDHLGAELDLNSAEGRARLDADARKLIEQMPGGTFRELIEARLSELVGLRRPTQAPSAQPRFATGRTRSRPQARMPLDMNPTRTAVALLLDNPALAEGAKEVDADWRDDDNPGADLLSKMINMAQAYPNIHTGELIEHWRDTEHDRALRRLATPDLLAHIPPEGRAAVFIDSLHKLNNDFAKKRRLQRILAARPGAAPTGTTDSTAVAAEPNTEAPDSAHQPQS